MRVEPLLGSRPRGIPRHIQDQKESEARFHLLPIVAIERFPEGEMEWDNDGATPSPLKPVECWPRLRGRRHRFNPRQVEFRGEAQPSTPANEPDVENRSTHQRTGAESTTGAPAEVSSGEPTPPREEANNSEPRDRRSSVFSRLGRTQRLPARRSPDRFPNIRNCPERGMLFGGLRFIPRIDWILYQGPASIVGGRATQGPRAATLQVCTATIVAGRGPPFSRVRGVVRPTESTCGSKERQEMENCRFRAHSDPQSAEEGTHRLPHRWPGTLGPVAGINPAPTATTSYRVVSPVAHVPPLAESDHPPTRRLDPHQHHRPRAKSRRRGTSDMLTSTRHLPLPGLPLPGRHWWNTSP